MSPNGLRRWRRYAKKCRYRSRKEGKRATGATAQGATVRALFWKARNHPIFALPPKPFTPRSLVGMTMGARKRAAWYEALRTSYDGDGGPISNRKLRLCLRSALTVRVLAVTVPIEWRLEVRAKYRIGERLRPCVGCLRCQCRSAFDAWPELGEELAKDHPTCDGSGVLPARKSK